MNKESATEIKQAENIAKCNVDMGVLKRRDGKGGKSWMLDSYCSCHIYCSTHLCLFCSILDL